MMQFPILIHTNNNQYVASLFGVPDFHVSRTTRRQAVEALRTKVEDHISEGELLFLDVNPVGLTSMAGAFKDDPTLDDICEEAYALRDAEV